MKNPDPNTIVVVAIVMIVGIFALGGFIIVYEVTEFVSSVGDKIPWVEANPIPFAIAVLFIMFGVIYYAARAVYRYIYY